MVFKIIPHSRKAGMKDLMNTETAGQMAGERHDFMPAYIDRFKSEWEGTL